MQQLIKYIETIVKLDEKAMEALLDLTEVESFKKNDHIVEYGKLCNKIWFLES